MKLIFSYNYLLQKKVAYSVVIIVLDSLPQIKVAIFALQKHQITGRILWMRIGGTL